MLTVGDRIPSIDLRAVVSIDLAATVLDLEAAGLTAVVLVA